MYVHYLGIERHRSGWIWKGLRELFGPTSLNIFLWKEAPAAIRGRGKKLKMPNLVLSPEGTKPDWVDSCNARFINEDGSPSDFGKRVERSIYFFQNSSARSHNGAPVQLQFSDKELNQFLELESEGEYRFTGDVYFLPLDKDEVTEDIFKKLAGDTVKAAIWILSNIEGVKDLILPITEENFEYFHGLI